MAKTQRVWSVFWLVRLHRWSALASGLFALLLCITGLPLIFADDIAAWQQDRGDLPHAGPLSAGRPASLDDIAAGLAYRQPGADLRYLGRRDDGNRFASYIAADGRWHRLIVAGDTGTVVADTALGAGVMAWLVDLHARLLSGRPGQWLLAAIGAVLVIAVVTGVVLHAPFMPRAGPLRPRTRRARLAWLDRHNLVGLMLAFWALLIVATGAWLALAGPIKTHWQTTALASLAAQDTAHPAGHGIGPETALAAARRQHPEAQLDFLAMPGSSYATAGGYGVYLAGARAYEHTAVWVSATAPIRVQPIPLGVLMQSEMVAQTLHLGGFAGLGLKLVWAALDLLLIVVIASGLWLWWQRIARPAKTRLPALAGTPS